MLPDEQIFRALTTLAGALPADADPIERRAPLITLMRLVFRLHAEDRQLLPPVLYQRFAQRQARAGHIEHNLEHNLDLQSRAQVAGASLFDDARFLGLAVIPDDILHRALQALLLDPDSGELLRYRNLPVEQLGQVYESLLGYELTIIAGAPQLRPGSGRRRTGSHYTPPSLSEPVVRDSLRPLLADMAQGPDRRDQLLALRICDPAMGTGAFVLAAWRELLALLEEAGLDPASAGLEVARHCLFGVDIDPLAVALARLSLWLAVADPHLPLDAFDAQLGAGDALVGAVQAELDDLRPDRAALVHDAAIAEFFQRMAGRRRKTRDQADPQALAARLRAGEAEPGLRQFVATFQQDTGLCPFHWSLRYPAIFHRDNPGFDVVIGNPPFLGGRNISATLGPTYLQYLIAHNPGASGGADLSAYFLRRAHAILREGGCLGLITTNTISQGDTREAGLAALRRAGACIYQAQRRLPWPGLASVIVSIVHARKGPVADKRLDGEAVADITAFLMPGGPDHPPARLPGNARRCFQGNIVLGVGFTFADGDARANSLDDMRALIEADPRNAERILPYIGGREVSDDPRQQHRRHVINFEELSEAEARGWPDLFAIVEARVKPQRLEKDGLKYPRMVHEWWKFWNYRSELYKHTAGQAQVLVVPLISKHLSFCFIPANVVISHKLAAFSLPGHGAFALLQCRVHEIWARFFSSTLGDGLNYSPTDCFETFPFPDDWQQDPALVAAGEAYDRHRADLMIAADEGMTRTYNRFHDPEERGPGILQLRALHAAMDRAALTAYGWGDLAAQARCEFVLEHDTPTARGRMQPWRYKWPQAFTDAVLARLLARNQALAASD